MISKTKVNKRMRKKTNSEIAEAIYLAKKNSLIDLAEALSVPTRKQAKVNIGDINKEKEDVIIVAGKVLSLGELNKKVKVYALGFSEKAKEKLKKSGSEFSTISDALKKDNKLKAKILR